MTKPELTPEQYVQHSGEPCPNCGDTRFFQYIQGYRHHTIAGSVIRRKAMCGECKAQWQDEFRLTGYLDLIVPVKEGE